MQAFVGDYWVVTFCRHSSTPVGAETEWQARADVYHLNEKTPTHCILSRTGFASCEAAKFIALNKGVTWARGRPTRTEGACPSATHFVVEGVTGNGGNQAR